MKIVAYLSLLRCHTHFARTNNQLIVYQNIQVKVLGESMPIFLKVCDLVQCGNVPVQCGYIPVQCGYIVVQCGYIAVQCGYITV